MEGLQRMIESIDFIENRLDNELLIDEIAKVACMSKFHYQRMFSMLTGYSVSEYIRNRRLTVAAQELSHGKVKVIDIALKYQYESPESFSKAFRKIHGISPMHAKKYSQSLKAYPKLSFQIQMKGDVEMEYKIVEKDAFRVLGKSIRTPTDQGEHHKAIATFWSESNQNGFAAELGQMSGSMGLLGICAEFDEKQENLTYMIAAEKTDQEPHMELEEKAIEAGTWAVFPVNGPMPGAMPKAWERIFSEWFPSTGYEHAGGPEMEVYPDERDPSTEDYYSEIWIKVIQK
ncbi:AraC family transcriptional regulator [Halobacillus fulvus]|nr:AraC family transcriptional regulator [Halobacillus fulvus]